MKVFWITLGVVTAVLVIRAGYNCKSAKARKEEMMRDQLSARTVEKATFGAG